MEFPKCVRLRMGYGWMLLDEDLGVCEAVLGRYWLS